MGTNFSSVFVQIECSGRLCERSTRTKTALPSCKFDNTRPLPLLYPYSYTGLSPSFFPVLLGMLAYVIAGDPSEEQREGRLHDAAKTEATDWTASHITPVFPAVCPFLSFVCLVCLVIWAFMTTVILSRPNLASGGSSEG